MPGIKRKCKCGRLWSMPKGLEERCPFCITFALSGGTTDVGVADDIRTLSDFRPAGVHPAVIKIDRFWIGNLVGFLLGVSVCGIIFGALTIWGS